MNLTTRPYERFHSSSLGRRSTTLVALNFWFGSKISLLLPTNSMEGLIEAAAVTFAANSVLTRSCTSGAR